MVSQHKYIFMSLVCLIWEYLRKRIHCPLNEKMENLRIPLLLKLSSESIAEAQRKFLFPSLLLSQTPESFLLSVSWILFVFNISFYLHCRECPWRIFLIVELVVSKPRRKLLVLLRYLLSVLRSFSYTVEGSRTNKGKYLLFFRRFVCDSSIVLSFISVTTLSLLGKSTDREKICADNTTRIHLSRFTAFFVVKNVQIQGGGVHAVHVRTKGGCWNLSIPKIVQTFPRQV